MSIERTFVAASDTQIESAFGLDELFFSRTDPRGIIKAGNDVFRRVSEFDWEDLIGAPHKLIRHPDMPRAAFHLLWERIQAGRTTGAYVKNRSRDGKYYWVFAIVSVIDGGYLSVRLKPTTALFDTIRAEYAQLRAVEQAQDLSPEDSAAALCQRLRALGWHDYDSFMADALAQETNARDTAQGRNRSVLNDPTMALLDAARKNLKEAEEVLAHLKSIALFPVNMRVIASHLSERGKQFAIISLNYGEICEGIQAQLRDFTHASRSLSAQVNNCVFQRCAALYQNEIATSFETENISNELIDTRAEASVLRALSSRFETELRESAASIAQDSRMLHSTCDRMHTLVRGLGMARTMGKIEAARLGSGADELNAMIDRLSDFQTQITANLSRIEMLNKNIGQNLEVMLADTNLAA